MTQNNFPLIHPNVARSIRAAWAVLIVLCSAALWFWYSPDPGPVGTPLRHACYAAAGGLALITAVFPLGGVLALAFVTPVLSGVPLAITGGSTYPILLFAGIGFVAGWLLRECITPRAYTGFRGHVWLWVFALMILISGGASFLRYNPPWQWFNPAFNNQPINVTMMARVDAIRFVVFVCANMFAALGVIVAVCAIIQRYHGRSHHVATMVLWALLLGAAVTSAVAVYQAQYNMNFCANRSYYWTRLARANGLCSDPNALGTLLALCVTLAALKLVFAGSFRSIGAWLQRLLALGAVSLFLVGLQYSGSRSGLLAVLIASCAAVLFGVLYYGNAALRRLNVPLLVRCACGLVIMMACVLVTQHIPVGLRYLDAKISTVQSSSSLVRRLKRDLRLFQQEGNVLDMVKDPRRLLYWRYAGIMWREFPLTGIGLGAYVLELPNYCAAANERLFRTDNACNYYLHYAAEMGTPALLVLALFYGTLLLGFVQHVKGWDQLSPAHKHHRIMLVVGLVTFLAVLIFGVHTMADEVNIAFAILLGLVAADHEAVLGTRRPVPSVMRGVIAAVVGVGLLAYAWRAAAANAGPLNGERRMAAFGLASEAGWYDWEDWHGVPFRVRWMARTAQTILAREGIELGIPVLANDPSVTSHPQIVSIYLNGRRALQHTIQEHGSWLLLRVPVPYANPFQSAGPPHTALRLAVNRTWVPRKVTGGDDDRALGVLVGEPRWLEPDSDAGGWHAPETAPDGSPFRWSSNYAWQRLPATTNAFINIPMYASNIQLRRWPLRVAVYLNRRHLDTITFTDKRWKNYRFPLPEDTLTNTSLLVEFIPSRTWVPKHYGFDDPRALGVAVGTMTLE